MTTEEFSNAFDTLISSYQHNALFGEQSSLADVTLDEYEKSLFLTLALDQIVKSYFERTLNSQGEGFDDSTRRQLDYSKLITTLTVTSLKSGSYFTVVSTTPDANGSYTSTITKSTTANTDCEAFSENGIMISFTDDLLGGYTDSSTGQYYQNTPLFIINERVTTSKTSYFKYEALNTNDKASYATGGTYGSEDIYCLKEGIYTKVAATDRATLLASSAPTYIRVYRKGLYTIVPISYKEYDRMTSKAYCEPLKRLAWRLFETDRGNLTGSMEIILRTDAGLFEKYVVRYIRRPRPIVLVDLDDTVNQLTIDGVSKITECELSPVIHNDILLLAVLLALASKGIETRDVKAAREQQKNNN